MSIRREVVPHHVIVAGLGHDLPVGHFSQRGSRQEESQPVPAEAAARAEDERDGPDEVELFLHGQGPGGLQQPQGGKAECADQVAGVEDDPGHGGERGVRDSARIGSSACFPHPRHGHRRQDDTAQDGQQPQGPAHVKIAQADAGRGPVPLIDEKRRDEEPGKHEENVNPRVTSGNHVREPQVEEHHGHHRHGPEAVQCWDVPHRRPGLRHGLNNPRLIPGGRPGLAHATAALGRLRRHDGGGSPVSPEFRGRSGTPG